MTALSAERNTKMLERPDILEMPVAASTTIYQGSIVCDNGSGYLVPGSTSTALKAVGRAEKTYDNSAGSAGDIVARVRTGIFRYANSSAGDAITIVERYDECYIVDDQTVAKTDGSATRSRAGVIIDVDSIGVWVWIGSQTDAEVASLQAGRLQKRELNVTTTEMTASATTQSFNIGAAVAANARIVGFDTPLATPISGGSISAATIDIGDATDPNAIGAAVDVFTAAVDGQTADRPLGIAPNKNYGGHQLTCLLTTTGDDIDNATAGDFTVTVFFMVLA